MTHEDRLKRFQEIHGYLPGTAPGKDWPPLTEAEVADKGPWCEECADWHPIDEEHSAP